jgi:hypothetical protein
MKRCGLWPSASLACIALIAVAACGPSSAASTSSPRGEPGPQAGAAPTNRPVPNVCESKVITSNDLASVLSGTIIARTLPGDPQTCEFSADGNASVSVTVRPGLGDVTVTEWAGGKMPAGTGTVNGIGDRAAWQSTLHELIATKHNVLCDLGSQGAKGSEADLQKKLGQLCDKIWAAQ